MSAKKSKVDAKCKVFNKWWTVKHCLLKFVKLSALCETNMWLYSETTTGAATSRQNAEKYRNLSEDEKDSWGIAS